MDHTTGAILANVSVGIIAIGFLMRITKAEILNGKYAVREDFPVPEWDGATVSLVALNDGEWAEVEALRLGGFDMNITGVNIDERKAKAKLGKLGEQPAPTPASAPEAAMRMDMQELTRSEHQADAQAVAYAMTHDGEVWTRAEVLQMRPASVVKTIAEQVYKISRVTPEDVKSMSTFRGDGSIGPDGVTPFVGRAVGTDAI